MRIIAGILVFLSLGSSTVCATSIVAVRDCEQIVIGADSKTTLLPGSGTTGAGSIAKCKIVQAGDLFFASAGSAGVGPAGFPGDIYPEFDLKESIASALQGSGGIVEKVKNLETVLVGNLTLIAEKARQEDPAFFLTRFVGHTVDTVIIGGIQNGEPVLMVRTFRLVVSPGGVLSFDIGRFSCPGDCPEAAITIFEGRTGAIRNYLEQHTLFLYFADPVTAVRDLVGLEISKDPSFVGPPVDILRLTKEGAEWVQRKPLCPDIREDPALPAGDNQQGLSDAARPDISCGE